MANFVEHYMKYMVLRDTREKKKKGWLWQVSKSCAGTTEETLKTGDYTIRGLENVLVIERKGSVSEWAKNICEARFEREMERLVLFKYPFILLEFNMGDMLNYPVGSGIPKWRWPSLAFTGSFVLKKTIGLQINYPTVPIILTGGRGQEVASSIFKRVIENETKTGNITERPE